MASPTGRPWRGSSPHRWLSQTTEDYTQDPWTPSGCHGRLRLGVSEDRERRNSVDLRGNKRQICAILCSSALPPSAIWLCTTIGISTTLVVDIRIYLSLLIHRDVEERRGEILRQKHPLRGVSLPVFTWLVLWWLISALSLMSSLKWSIIIIFDDEDDDSHRYMFVVCSRCRQRRKQLISMEPVSEVLFTWKSVVWNPVNVCNPGVTLLVSVQIWAVFTK